MEKQFSPKQKELFPFRARGLQELARRVGDVRPIIDRLLSGKDRIRILELGCGFGVALMELRKLYEERVELFGVNKLRSDGDWDVFKMAALAKGICIDAKLEAMAPINLVYVDAGVSLPFPDDHFDFVFSQVSFMYYANKARCLEEVNRILAPHGLARIDVNIRRAALPKKYACGFEIWSGKRKLSFWSFVKRFDSLVRRRRNFKNYLELRKAKTLDLGLRLMHVTNLNELSEDWFGQKSVYQTMDPL